MSDENVKVEEQNLEDKSKDVKEIILINQDTIKSKIYLIRGQKVMLDYDLAEIYGYEVKRLNEQVKRNIARFPEDFMFQLTKDEIPEDISKSQIATLNENGDRRGTNIKQNQQFVTQSEMSLVTAKLCETSIQISGIIDWKNKTNQDIDNIQRSIEALNKNFISDKDFKNFVIYKGQKFEADKAYIDIYQKATTSIYVIDNYMNTKTLQLLSQKKQGVEVVLFTENGHGHKGFLTSAVVNDFINQYPPLHIKSNPDCHDRLIVIDYGMQTEQVYHCGASSKDAGKRLCAINKIENTEIIHPVIDGLLLGADKII